MGARVALAVALAATGLVVPDAPASAASSWSIVASPNPAGTTNSNLAGVSCLTRAGCFAVGSRSVSGGMRTLTEQWNGTSWSIVASLNAFGTVTDYLFGVSCSSGTTCLAVGDSSMYPPENTALVEVWNGSSWSIVASPNVNETTDNALFDVSCSAGNDCLAVGTAVGSDWWRQTMARQWNGMSLSIVASPTPSGSGHSGLGAVSCPAGGICLAVGGRSAAGAEKTLTERWNGTKWSIVASPNTPGTTNSHLHDVSCTTSSYCFAVGDSYNTSTHRHKVLIERLS